MSVKKHVLLIDDDIILRDSLVEQLELDGEFETSTAGDGKDGLVQATAGGVDLIILDVGLPDADGRDICRKMRDQGVKTPIIMLTAADSSEDTVKGFDSGANDYVAKPFRFNVLMARIRAQLRQFERSEDATLRIGPYLFQPTEKFLQSEGSTRKIRLTEKEAAILKYLYRANHKPVSRKDLLTEVWGYNPEVTTHTLETHIYRLRQKIEPDAGNQTVLLTDEGGYRLGD